MSHHVPEKLITPLARAIGRIPSGLFILTVRCGSDETGMLASWIQQCSFAPPQVVVAVNKERYIVDWLKPETAFAVNVLAEGQTNLVKHFSRGFEPGHPAFDGLEVARVGDGAPHLLAAHAYIDCRVQSTADGGDHMLVIGRVVGGEMLHDLRPVVHIRKNGLSY